MIKSPIKWAGGKSRLMKEIEVVYPKNFIEHPETFTYIEPFAGGGSCWLYVLQTYNPKAIIANDINPMIINFWEVVKKYPTELCDVLEDIQSKYASMTWEERKDAYHEAKNAFNELKMHYVDTDIELAALFLFLNKTCFNGLYRTNKKGDFNTAFGKPANPNAAPVIYNRQDIMELSRLIQNVVFTCGDYKHTVSYITDNTLAYFDPPYRGTWTGYSKDGFDESDQEELAEFCELLKEENCYIIQSNSMCGNNFFEKNYPDFNIKVVNNVGRNIRPTAERKVQEILMYNLAV